MGLHGTAISWTGGESSIGPDGTVTRPSYDQGDRTVKLTATITKGEAHIQKEFDLIVKTLPKSGDVGSSSHSKNTTADLTVTFKANDGSDKTVAQKTTKNNGTVTLPEEPDRDGYTFIGWNKKTDGKGYTFTAMTNVTQSLEVYAQ